MARTVRGERSIYTPASLPGVDHLRAQFVRHAFARHTHDDVYVIGLIEEGAQASRLGNKEHVSTKGTVVLINPTEAHDGRTTGEVGYAYHSLHVDAAVLARILADEIEDGATTGRGGVERFPFFAAPLLNDPEVTSSLRLACDSLSNRNANIIERESLLLEALTLLLHRRCALVSRPVERDIEGPLARTVRDYLHAHMTDAGISVDRIARACGRTRSHVTRIFARSYGLAPHAYLNQIRAKDARRQLLAGEKPSAVAVAVGFVDQSHLTRRLRAIYGITPGVAQAAWIARTSGAQRRHSPAW